MLVRVSHDNLSDGESSFIGQSIGMLINDVFDIVLCMDVNNYFIRVISDNDTVRSYLSEDGAVTFLIL